MAADTDSRLDLYQRSGGVNDAALDGAIGRQRPLRRVLQRCVAGTVQRVFFETAEQLAGDTDAFSDVYEREGGTTTRRSAAPGGGGNGAFIAVFLGTSDDGSRVFYSSAGEARGPRTPTTSPTSTLRASHPRTRGPREPRRPRSRSCPPTSDAKPASPTASTARRRWAAVPATPRAARPCRPPTISTVGTPDSNSLFVSAMGSASFISLVGDPGTPADEADVRLQVSITDIRRKSDLSDYAGELQANASARITDKYNGSVPSDPGVVQELSFPFPVPCVTTSSPNSGSTCSVTTTADTLVPGAIREGARAIWNSARSRSTTGARTAMSTPLPTRCSRARGSSSHNRSRTARVAG